MFVQKILHIEILLQRVDDLHHCKHGSGLVVRALQRVQGFDLTSTTIYRIFWNILAMEGCTGRSATVFR